MMTLAVAATVHFALEGSTTDIAGKWLEPSVLSGVGDKIGGLTEGLATDGALVWFLACMNIGVLLHIRLLMKALPAVFTWIRPSV